MVALYIANEGAALTDAERDRRTYFASGASTSSTLLTVHNKYSGEPAYEVPVSTPGEVRTVVTAAMEALADPLPAHERYKVLMAVAAELEADTDVYVDALVAEGGKPLKASRAEVARSVETLRWSAEEAKRLTGEFIPLDASPIGVGRYAVTLREPVGVVAAITPTNSPLC
jgi:acyl-CoA reductase-like NAD-dependent aldehyde dehydrogenase